MKKLENDDSNLGDELAWKARLKGALGLYDETDDDDIPYVHTVVRHEGSREHYLTKDCWCEPFVEFHTEFVKVFRHRRMQ